MPETYGNWLGLVNRCICYGHGTHAIYQVLPYSVDLKLPEARLSKTVLDKYSSIPNKGIFLGSAPTSLHDMLCCIIFQIQPPFLLSGAVSRWDIVIIYYQYSWHCSKKENCTRILQLHELLFFGPSNVVV